MSAHSTTTSTSQCSAVSARTFSTLACLMPHGGLESGDAMVHGRGRCERPYRERILSPLILALFIDGAGVAMFGWRSNALGGEVDMRQRVSIHFVLSLLSMFDTNPSEPSDGPASHVLCLWSRWYVPGVLTAFSPCRCIGGVASTRHHCHGPRSEAHVPA